MTTAPATRRPSPADLATPAARERAARRLADLLAPAERELLERFRPAFTRAIRQSGMSPHPRLVAMTLASYANGEDGVIRDNRQPGLHGLAEHTGLSLAQVVATLRILRSRGWVSTTRSGSRTLVQPHIPQHAVPSLTRTRPTAQTDQITQ